MYLKKNGVLNYMDPFDIAFLTIGSISCVWSAIWLLFFILKYRQIKELLNYKDYMGVLGLYLLVLGLVNEIAFYSIKAETFNILGGLIIIAGVIVLINWVIWSIVNLSRKVEKINENIAAIGYIIEIFLSLFFGVTLDISTSLEFLIFTILIFIIFFFWSGTMMYTLINIDKFRNKGEAEKKEITIREKAKKVPTTAEHLKERSEIYECSICGSKLSADLRKKYSMGKTVFCTYCGNEIE